MDRRLARHAVIATLALALAAAPLRAQVLAPVAARHAAMPAPRLSLAPIAPAPRALPGQPGSTLHAVTTGAGIGALTGMVIGGYIGSRHDCSGDNSGVCPMLGALGGGTIGFVSGLVGGGVAGYVWHKTRPAVR